MKKTVYIESSVISYLAARPTNDLIKSARQAITDDWWKNYKSKFDVFISALVEEEISRGNRQAAELRLKISEDIPNLKISSNAKEIASVLISKGAIPKNNEEDALHIGIATAHGIQYLLTWNFKHINNAQTKNTINKTIKDLGYLAPVLCSPEELGVPL